MMTAKKTPLSLLAAIVAAFAFTACGGDDLDQGNNMPFDAGMYNSQLPDAGSVPADGGADTDGGSPVDGGGDVADSGPELSEAEVFCAAARATNGAWRCTAPNGAVYDDTVTTFAMEADECFLSIEGKSYSTHRKIAFSEENVNEMIAVMVARELTVTVYQLIYDFETPDPSDDIWYQIELTTSTMVETTNTSIQSNGEPFQLNCVRSTQRRVGG